MHVTARTSERSPKRSRYQAPTEVVCEELQAVLHRAGRDAKSDEQFDMLRTSARREVFLYHAGDIEALQFPTVSIVGTRDVSEDGWKRATRLSRGLAEQGVTVMSGLARGVDTAALTGAMRAGGRVVAVIGTALGKAYPAENGGLQEEIYRSHLLISPFSSEEPVYKSNFPKRNRVMALLSDATVIVEASDTSGTLHQAAECQRLGRWLFIAKSVAENPNLKWPASFLGKPKTAVLEEVSNILAVLG